jgi:DinB superfamily
MAVEAVAGLTVAVVDLGVVAGLTVVDLGVVVFTAAADITEEVPTAAGAVTAADARVPRTETDSDGPADMRTAAVSAGVGHRARTAAIGGDGRARAGAPETFTRRSATGNGIHSEVSTVRRWLPTRERGRWAAMACMNSDAAVFTAGAASLTGAVHSAIRMVIGADGAGAVGVGDGVGAGGVQDGGVGGTLSGIGRRTTSMLIVRGGSTIPGPRRISDKTKTESSKTIPRTANHLSRPQITLRRGLLRLSYRGRHNLLTKGHWRRLSHAVILPIRSVTVSEFQVKGATMMRLRFAGVGLVVLMMVSLSGHAQNPPQPVTLRSLLLHELHTTHNQADWFVPISTAVDGLTAEQASWQPPAGAHSAGQLTYHLLFWNRRNLVKFKGETLEKFGGDNEETFSKFDTKQWNDTVKQLDQVMTDLEKLVETADEAKLAKWAPTIGNISTHNAYHVGQIVYVRKLQGSWNPEKGVK